MRRSLEQGDYTGEREVYLEVVFCEVIVEVVYSEFGARGGSRGTD